MSERRSERGMSLIGIGCFTVLVFGGIAIAQAIVDLIGRLAR